MDGNQKTIPGRFTVSRNASSCTLQTKTRVAVFDVILCIKKNASHDMTKFLQG